MSNHAYDDGLPRDVAPDESIGGNEKHLEACQIAHQRKSFAQSLRELQAVCATVGGVAVSNGAIRHNEVDR